MSSLRMTVVGLGTIGGSLAQALRARGHIVTGVDSNADTLKAALARGVVGQGSEDTRAAVADCDVVILAMPVGVIAEAVPAVAASVRPGCVVVDTGSVKECIVESMNAASGGGRWVGGHPIAGSDMSGPEAWSDSLFRGRTFVLCKTATTDEATRRFVEELVVSVGAVPHWLRADEHDELIATTSQLPLLLAVAMTRQTGDLHQRNEQLSRIVGGQLRSVTRMADSPVQMLSDIFRYNHDNLVDCFSELSKEVAAILRAAQEGSAEDLLAGLDAIRAGLLADLEKPGSQ